MPVHTDELSVDTRGRRVVDVTPGVEAFVEKLTGEGLVNVFVPHATAGVALVETGAGSEQDLEEALERLLPRDERYTHRHGSPGHGADHLLPALVCPSIVIPLRDGRMALGTWQRIVLVDPNRENNRRTVLLSVLQG